MGDTGIKQVELADNRAGALASNTSDDVFGLLTFLLVVIYVVLNRLVEDIYTLPVGFSIRPSEAVVVLLGMVLALWMITSHGPLPRGAAGLLGAGLLLILLLSPLINAPTMSEFEANGAERGLVHGVLLAILFLATYQVARNLRHAFIIIWFILAFTVAQGGVAIYETITRQAFPILGPIWETLGLQVDPKGFRGQLVDLRLRLTGETRAASTAPHPIVLSALLAVGIAIAVILYLNTGSKLRRRLYLVAMVVQLAALGTTASRTGFLLLALAGVLVLFTQIRHLPRSAPVIATLAVGGLVLASVAPRTPRLILNLFTNPTSDHNVAVRVSKIEFISGFLERRPLIGAGYLTHDRRLVEFDNSYFVFVVELGMLGLLVLVAFFLVVFFRSYGALSAASAEEQPLLVIGAVAGITLLVGGATFGAWSFAQFFPTCLILMAIGLSRSDEIRARSGLRVATGDTG